MNSLPTHPFSLDTATLRIEKMVRRNSLQFEALPLAPSTFVRDSDLRTVEPSAGAPMPLIRNPEDDEIRARIPTSGGPVELFMGGGLRTGFKILKGCDPWHFEVYKGIGFSLSRGSEMLVEGMANLFGISFLPLPHRPHSPFRVMDMGTLGTKLRWAGAALHSAMVADARFYVALQRPDAPCTPGLVAVFRFQDTLSEVLGLPVSTQRGSAHTIPDTLPDEPCGQSVRWFRNAFRVEDLWLLRRCALSEQFAGFEAALRRRAEEIAEISSLILACGPDPVAFSNSFASRVGDLAARIVNVGLLHKRLSLHLQNLTLAGEVTEFDVAEFVDPLGDQRWEGLPVASTLALQILLLANHVRQLAVCLRWLGLSLRDDDLVQAFADAIVATLKPQLAPIIVAQLDSSVSANLERLGTNWVQREILAGCQNFVDQTRKAICAGLLPL